MEESALQPAARAEAATNEVAPDSGASNGDDSGTELQNAARLAEYRALEEALDEATPTQRREIERQLAQFEW